MNKNIAVAIAISLLMLVPAGAFLGIHYNSNDNNAKIDHSSQSSGFNPYHILETSKDYRTSNTLQMDSLVSQTYSGSEAGFKNLTPLYQASLNGTVGIYSIASNGISVGYIGVTSTYKTYVGIVNGSQTFTINIRNYTLYDIYSYYNYEYIVYGLNYSNSVGYNQYFIVYNNIVKPINFNGINASDSSFLGFYNDLAFVEVFSANNNYLNIFYPNGTLYQNLTYQDHIPTGDNFYTVTPYEGSYYLGGSNTTFSGTKTISHYLVSEIKGSTFETLSVGGNAVFVNAGNGKVEGESDGVYNLIPSGGNIFAIGGEYYYNDTNGLNSTIFSAIADNITEINLTTHEETNLSNRIAQNSIPDSPIQTLTMGNISLIIMQSYYANLSNSAVGYYTNFEYLLNNTNGDITNVTNLFSSNIAVYGAVALNGNFYLGVYDSNLNADMRNGQYANILEYNFNTDSVSASPFSPSTGPDSDSPTYWVSNSVSGDDGVLTVGGNGFDFYRSGTFISSGNVSSGGFLLGAAWNGKEFLLVGQKYFESSYPNQGVLAYIYYPGNNTVVNITSVFPSWLKFNATLISVANISDNFLIQGIANTTTTGNPVLFIYNTTSGILTREESQIPSFIRGVSSGEIVAANGYAYIAYAWSSGSTFIMWYHNNIFGDIGPNVTHYSVLEPNGAAYQMNSLYTNGQSLYVFEHENGMIVYQKYSFSTNKFTGAQGNINYYGRLNYVTGYDGNVMIFGNYTGQKFTDAYGFNVSDGILSQYPQAPSVYTGEPYAAVQYNNSIFLVTGAFGNVYYGLWKVNFSAFGTNSYTLTFNYSNLSKTVKIPYTWTVSVDSSTAEYANSSSTDTVSLTVPEGTYPYYVYLSTKNEYDVYLMQGTVNVTHSMIINISNNIFNLSFEALNFNSNLQNWDVLVQSLSEYGLRIVGSATGYNSSPIIFYVPSGSYEYSVVDEAYGTNHTLILNEQDYVNSNQTVKVSFPVLYRVEFVANPTINESWFLSLSYGYNNTMNITDNRTITQYLPNGSYVARYGINIVSVSSSSISFNVSGASKVINIGLPKVYVVNFTLKNLPSNNPFYIGWIYTINENNVPILTSQTYNGSKGSVDLTNGSYNISFELAIKDNSSYSELYYVVTAFSNITVHGTNQTVIINSDTLYKVSLNINGIPLNEYFSYVISGPNQPSKITINGKADISSSVYLPNGSYVLNLEMSNSYPYFLLFKSVYFNVSGNSLTLNEYLYNISFDSNNIASYRFFSLFINNIYISPVNGTFTIFSANMSFSYNANAFVNYANSSTNLQTSGEVKVLGRDQTVSVMPSKLYLVTFEQKGLPSLGNWGVNGYLQNEINESVNFDTREVSAAETVSVLLPNGTYSIPSFTYGNYFSNASSFIVSGKNITVLVYYSDKITLNFIAFNLPPGEVWGVDLNRKVISSNSTIISTQINDTAVFNFSVTPPEGYSATPEYGTINLTSMRNFNGLQNGNSENITVIFNNNSVGKYGYVGETLNLLNDSIMAGDFIQSPTFYNQIFNAPIFSTFDPSNGKLYVTSLSVNPSTGAENGAVLIINATDYSVTGRILLGPLIPYESAYDPSDGNIFISAISLQSNSGSHQTVIEINTSSNAVSSLNISVTPSNAFDIIYDSFNKDLYATAQNGLVIINASTFSIVGYINITSSVNKNEIAQVVQGAGDTLLVSGYSNNVTEINVTNDDIIRNITLNVPNVVTDEGKYFVYVTGSLLFDRQNSEIYIQVISNSTSGNFTSNILVFGLSGNLLKTIQVPLADSYQMSLDTKTNDIWMASFYSLLPGDQKALNFQGIVTELNASNNQIIQNLSTGFTTVGASYDEASDSMIITNLYSSTISIIGTNFVAQKLNQVTFSENGLPSGTIWYVNFSSGFSYSSNGNSITLYLQNGTYSYTVSSLNRSYTTSNYTGTIIVDGKSITKIIDFHIVTYTVDFVETGLPIGADWYVNISGEPGSGPLSSRYYNISLPNGTYMITIASNESQYKAKYHDEITVSGSNLTVPVLFSNTKFGVQFREDGLPAGTGWYINITGYPSSGLITSQYFNTSLPNGTYYYSVYSADPGFIANVGQFSVNGHADQINVSFQPRTYGVTFTESGLQSGVAWYVNISGISSSGPIYTSYYNVNLTDGSYSFSSATSNKDYSPVYNSSFSVDGSNVGINVVFKQVLYKVTFTENGLPGNIYWYVNITGLTSSGPIVNSVFTAYLTNGTYSFKVASANKIYEPSYNGKFIISGSGVNTPVQFTEVTFRVTFAETGLPTGTLWVVNLSNSILDSTVSTITFTGITNGTYTYSIHEISGYFSSISIGKLVVNGHSVTMNVTWNKTAYVISFKESGLPQGSYWYVNVTGHSGSGPLSGSVFNISLPNGTYSYEVSTNNKDFASPGASFTIIGQRMTVPVVFHSITYSLEFVESGLPSGTLWKVTVDGNGLSSTSDAITFQVINGSYTYNVAGVPGYHTDLYSSSVTVSGSDVTIDVSWYINIYNITFIESGLPTGAQWNLSFEGVGHSNTTGQMIFHVPNGTYTYAISEIRGYTVSYPGIVTVAGSNVIVTVDFVKNATVYIEVATSGSVLTVNGLPITMYNDSTKLSVAPGYYFVNVSKSGYYTFTNLYDLHSSTYYINVTLKPLVSYGFLNGTVIPGSALISASGIDIAVVNGSFNQSLSPGTYLVSVSASGYLSASYEVNITQNTVTNLKITLIKAKESYTISGYVNPNNSSVMFGGYIAYVNSTGYYTISLPSGTYMISVTATGYFSFSENYSLNSNSELNFTLTKEPTPTSVTSNSTVVAAGYNVTVSNLTTGNGNISLTYNSSANGTLTVVLPYNEVKNATLSDIMNSSVYVNGVKYTNYTLALSANNGTFSVILTVYGLKGDPTLIWAYSPAVKVIPPLKPSQNSPINQYLYITFGVAVVLMISVSVAYFVIRKKH